MQNKPLKTLTYHAGQWQENETPTISEKPVSLTVNGEMWLTFMCTPTDLEALAAGFLYNEEIIQQKEDIANLRVCPENENIDAWLNQAVKKPDTWTRTTGCSGGETGVDRVAIPAGDYKISGDVYLSAGKVSDLMRKLTEAQDLYRQSGGVHTSAICDGEKIILSAEDIGRHNTLDKLAGRCLLEGIHLDRTIILTTGRVSSEMVQKSGRMGAAVVVSRTSPTSLSVEMAEHMGITLIGYARGNQFTIYSHPERITPVEAKQANIGEEA